MVRRIRIRGHVVQLCCGVTPSTSTSLPDSCAQCGTSFDGGPFRKCEYLCCNFISCLECAKNRNKFHCEKMMDAGEQELKAESRKRFIQSAYYTIVSLYSGSNCSICDKFFRTKSGLSSHMRHHNKNKNEDLGEKTIDIPKSNVVSQKKSLPFRCRYCRSRFSSLELRNLHIKKRHADKVYNCIFCDKDFFSQGKYDEHIRTHIGEKPYTCHVCNLEFTTSKQLNSHVLSQSHRDHQIPSGKCLRRLEGTEETEESRANHTNENEQLTKARSFLCTICYKLFEKEEFDLHLRSHKQPEPAVGAVAVVPKPRHENKSMFCRQCGKQFSYKKSLQSHCNRLQHSPCYLFKSQ